MDQPSLKTQEIIKALPWLEQVEKATPAYIAKLIRHIINYDLTGRFSPSLKRYCKKYHHCQPGVDALYGSSARSNELIANQRNNYAWALLNNILYNLGPAKKIGLLGIKKTGPFRLLARGKKEDPTIVFSTNSGRWWFTNFFSVKCWKKVFCLLRGGVMGEMVTRDFCQDCGAYLAFSTRQDGLGRCHPCARKYLLARVKELEEELHSSETNVDAELLAEIKRRAAECRHFDQAAALVYYINDAVNADAPWRSWSCERHHYSGSGAVQECPECAAEKAEGMTAEERFHNTAAVGLDRETGLWRGLFYRDHPTPSGCSRPMLQTSTTKSYTTKEEALAVITEGLRASKIEHQYPVFDEFGSVAAWNWYKPGRGE